MWHLGDGSSVVASISQWRAHSRRNEILLAGMRAKMRHLGGGGKGGDAVSQGRG